MLDSLNRVKYGYMGGREMEGKRIIFHENLISKKGLKEEASKEIAYVNFNGHFTSIYLFLLFVF